uniref:RNase H type-1 domain-containing protein n=1 Tax=Vitis vinifera TaxID=29760 RepID=A5BG58_VITVI|nr:hypothetical protein VITISV_008334 [Vitis vinifera]
MAAIAHFISRCTDCLKPFFNVIKKAKTFEWIAECEEAFLAIKSYLISPLILKSPQLGDPLYMYLATSKLVVSAVLFKLGLDGSQLPIYYVSKTMFPTKQSYTLLEKAVRLGFHSSNNEVGYEALLIGISLALLVQASHLNIRSDSQLVVNQVQGGYEARYVRMVRYLKKVKNQLQKFSEWKMTQITREENARANALAEVVASLAVM